MTGEVQTRGLGFCDVFRPFVVGFGRVHAQADDLDVAFVEFGFQLSAAFTQLVVANRRETWDARINAPTVAKPFVKSDGAFSGLCCEIWRYRLCE